MPDPTNKILYSQVLSEAKRKFKVWPSAYGSMWLTKTYKARGGTYSGEKSETTKNGGTTRWQAEQWVNMGDYLAGKTTRCGMPEGAQKSCRPLRRISSSTPTTAGEVVRRHGEAKTREMVNAKEKDQKGTRVNWNTGNINKK